MYILFHLYYATDNSLTFIIGIYEYFQKGIKSTAMNLIKRFLRCPFLRSILMNINYVNKILHDYN